MIKRCNSNIKLYRSKLTTFKDSWQKIRNSNQKEDQAFDNSLENGQTFEEILLYQYLITENTNIYKNQIEFSNFTQVSALQLNPKNLFDCFHGILNFIYYYSNNKYNIEELEFHYTGCALKNYISMKQNMTDQNDIMYIFDYENIGSEFRISCSRDAFFGVTFKRIRINPISYSIRSGIFSAAVTHLTSFTFEGFDENENRWDVLDERDNINDLIVSGGFNMFFVMKTNKYYSSFKIKQTKPGSNDFWGFSVSAFDVHGVIAYRDNLIEEISNNLTKTDNFNEDLCLFQYNPFEDMTDLI